MHPLGFRTSLPIDADVQPQWLRVGRGFGTSAQTGWHAAKVSMCAVVGGGSPPPGVVALESVV